MNKTELITAVAQEAEMTKKDAEKAVKAVIDVVSGALAKGEKVQLIGFGTFEVRERKAREGHNPSTQEVIKIPASKTPAFRVSKQLKEKVNVKPAKKTRAKKAANAAVKSQIHGAIKKAVAAANSENKDEAFRAAVSIIDSAAKKGVIHKNAAARKKSRLNANVNAAIAAEKAAEAKEAAAEAREEAKEAYKEKMEEKA